MLSYWILLYLIFCGCQNNNNGCNNRCTNRQTDSKRKCDRRSSFESESNKRREPDCDDNSFIQPRPFNNSFTVQNTCGYENKSE